MNLLITITASTLEELQWRIQEMKKLLISQDMNLHSCYFLQEQGIFILSAAGKSGQEAF